VNLSVFRTIRRSRFVDVAVQAVAFVATLTLVGAGFSLAHWPSYSFHSRDFVFMTGYASLVSLLLAGGVHLGLGHMLRRTAPFGGSLKVGDDGIEVVESARPSFVSHAEVREVRVESFRRQVVLDLKDGSSVRFRVTEPKSVVAEIAKRAYPVRWDRGARVISAFGGAHEDIADWIAKARQMLSGGFRDRVATVEQLEMVAVDPRAEPEQRIGAALALEGAPPPVRMRVRTAAEATARPHVGEAMTMALEGDLDEELLGRALSEN